MAERRPCAHEACSCEAEENQEFCSQHCAEAKSADPDDRRCACGHAECG